MQDVAIEARDRADARKEQTLVPAEKMYLGLGKQDIYIIGKSKEFDLDELEVWMLYRTKAHPPRRACVRSGGNFGVGLRHRQRFHRIPIRQRFLET